MSFSMASPAASQGSRVLFCAPFRCKCREAAAFSFMPPGSNPGRREVRPGACKNQEDRSLSEYRLRTHMPTCLPKKSSPVRNFVPSMGEKGTAAPFPNDLGGCYPRGLVQHEHMCCHLGPSDVGRPPLARYQAPLDARGEPRPVRRARKRARV